MCTGFEIGMLIAATAAVGTQTYQAVAANQTKQQAKGEQNKQRDEMLKARQDELARQGQMETKEAEATARTAARNRQRAIAGGLGGRRETILTQGLGQIAAPAPAAEKTLLGA